MSEPQVTIIVLNWNGRKDTAECIESLERITYPNYKVMIVDNGSVDGSAEFVRKNYPRAEVLENGENLGFAEGNNVGIRQALGRGADYVLLLNNDTVVNPDFLDLLVARAEGDDQIGVVGPVVYYYDDRNLIQSAGARVSFFTSKQRIDQKNKPDDGSLVDPIECDYVSGCALLAKREVFEKIGYLNPSYFLYWEETDWCVRAKRAGFKILCIPGARIWHKESASSKKVKGLSLYYLTRNRIWFMRHNTTGLQYVLFLAYYLTCRMTGKSLKYLMYYRDVHSLITYARGVFDGVTKRAPREQPQAGSP